MAVEIFYLLLVSSTCVGAEVSVGSSRTFYLDSSSTCGTTVDFSSFSQDAYVKAWSSSSRLPSYSSSCAITFDGYAGYDMKFNFNGGAYIRDCGVEVRVYDSIFTSGTPLQTYSCHSSFSTSSISSSFGWLTVELYNPYRDTNYDFEIHVQNLDNSKLSSGDIAAIVAGVSAFLIFITCLSACVRRRQIRRREIIRERLIISTPAQPNYPVGAAPYPGSYGSVSAAPPPASYPPAGSAAPPPYAGAPPPPSQPSAPPPPPVYN